MPAGLLFWIIMLLSLLSMLAGSFGLWSHGVVIGTFINWILLALLGWKVYGPALHQ